MHTLSSLTLHNARDVVEHVRQPRILALGGIVGPWLWTMVVILLTLFEYDTLTAFGWTPGQDNGVHYPSSLALGPLGWIQMLNFVVLGLCLLALAVGLHRVVRPGLRTRVGPVLLGVAAMALIFALFPTDHGPPDAPATWHGVIHAVAFGGALVPLLLGLFALGASFSGDRRWPAYAWLCPVIGLLALASFVFGGLLLPPSVNQVAFYAALLVIFVGLTLIGLRLRQLATMPGAGPSAEPMGAAW